MVFGHLLEKRQGTPVRIFGSSNGSSRASYRPRDRDANARPVERPRLPTWCGRPSSADDEDVREFKPLRLCIDERDGIAFLFLFLFAFGVERRSPERPTLVAGRGVPELIQLDVGS
jgi:hypothetical protein